MWPRRAAIFNLIKLATLPNWPGRENWCAQQENCILFDDWTLLLYLALWNWKWSDVLLKDISKYYSFWLRKERSPKLERLTYQNTLYMGSIPFFCVMGGTIPGAGGVAVNNSYVSPRSYPIFPFIRSCFYLHPPACRYISIFAFRF